MSSIPTSSIKHRLSIIWDVLVKPHPSLQEIETQKNARLLSGMLIVSSLAIVIIMIFVGLLDSYDIFIPVSIVAYLIVAICIGLYFVNRAGYFRQSLHTFIITLTFLLVILPYIPNSSANVSPFAVIPIILVGIFYSGNRIYLTTAIVLGTTFILNQLKYETSQFWRLQTSWYFLIFASGLIVVFVRHLHDLEQLRHQKLEEANQQLRESEEKLEHRVAERTVELQVAYDKVEALNRVKDEFVSNVSHELRTPITSIKLQNYLAKQSASPKQLAYLDTLQRETDRLETLIEALLTLSRLDQKSIELQFKQINLNQIVEEYTIDRRPLAESKQLNLETIVCESDVWITGDRHLLGQVLSILLTNAFNYTPAGGKIVISTAEFTNQYQEKWARFSVKDTGMGIPPDEQQQLFSRFFRGHSARETKVAGTGLGLSIAKKIIDEHSGLIEVESSGLPNQGTTFHIHIPAQLKIS